MKWWANTQTFGVTQAATRPSGPGWLAQSFATQAEAEAAASGGGGGGQWYVITIRQTPQTPFTVEVSQKPFPSGAGITALEDSGPYATKTEAQAAASKLTHEIVPGIPALGSAPDWQKLMVQIGEVLLGLILIGIGVAHLTNAVPLATKVAGAAAKGVLP